MAMLSGPECLEHVSQVKGERGRKKMVAKMSSGQTRATDVGPREITQDALLHAHTAQASPGYGPNLPPKLRHRYVYVSVGIGIYACMSTYVCRRM